MSVVDKHNAANGAGWVYELGASQHQKAVFFNLLASDLVPAEMANSPQKPKCLISEHRAHKSVHAPLTAFLIAKNKV